MERVMGVNSRRQCRNERFCAGGGKKAGADKPTPFLLLVKKVPTYKKFLPWYETAQEVIDQTLPAEFYKALDEFPAR